MSATTTTPAPATHPVATQAAKLPQSRHTKTNIKDSIITAMRQAKRPLCDTELAKFINAHPNTIRAHREQLLASGTIKFAGYKDMGGRRSHMTFSPVIKGRRSAQIAALRKHILDGLQRISCAKKTISEERKLLRALESRDTAASRKRAGMAAVVTD